MEVLSSQYLRGSTTAVAEHVTIHVQVSDVKNNLEAVRALVDCGASGTFVSSQLVERLGLPTLPAGVTTLAIDGNVLVGKDASTMTDLGVLYEGYAAPVTETEVLVVPNLAAYDLVLGLPWFRRHRPEIDWSKGVVKRLCGPGAHGQERMEHDDGRADGCAGTNAVDNGTHVEELDAEAYEAPNSGGSGPIEVLSAMAFARIIESDPHCRVGLINVSERAQEVAQIGEPASDAESSRVCGRSQERAEQWGPDDYGSDSSPI